MLCDFIIIEMEKSQTDKSRKIMSENENVSHSVVFDSLQHRGLCSPPGFSVHGIL